MRNWRACIYNALYCVHCMLTAAEANVAIGPAICTAQKQMLSRLRNGCNRLAQKGLFALAMTPHSKQQLRHSKQSAANGWLPTTCYITRALRHTSYWYDQCTQCSIRLRRMELRARARYITRHTRTHIFICIKLVTHQIITHTYLVLDCFPNGLMQPSAKLHNCTWCSLGPQSAKSLYVVI